MASRRNRGTAGTWVSGGVNEPTPVVEQKPEAMDTTEVDLDDGTTKKKEHPHWVKLGPDGKVIKRKPNPAKRNAMFRKHLQPKTAVMCLNELVTGLKYTTEAMAPIGNFSASVEVDGVTYRGYGSSKTLAKQAAAEAALVSFVKPPPPKAGPGEPEMEDETPWKTIASFAMYKLFAEWSESSGARPVAAQPDANAAAASTFENTNAVPDLRNYLTQIQHQQMDTDQAPQAPRFPAALKAPGTTAAVPPKPAKNLSEEVKTNNHPVMVVHQLCPLIQYDIQEENDPITKTKSYTVTAEVAGNVYSGTGQNSKKAKYDLCKSVLREGYGIENVHQA